MEHPLFDIHAESFEIGFGRGDPRVGPGVYLLFDKGELVYVGQAVNMLHRFSTHASGKPPVKEFDNAFFVPMPVSDIAWCEATLIQICRPRHNLSVPVMYRWSRPPRTASHVARKLVATAASRGLDWQAKAASR